MGCIAWVPTTRSHLHISQAKTLRPLTTGAIAHPTVADGDGAKRIIPGKTRIRNDDPSADNRHIQVCDAYRRFQGSRLLHHL